MRWILALALATSFAHASARADEPAPGAGETYALAPDSLAAPSGPVATAPTVESSDPATATPAALTVEAASTAAAPAATAPPSDPPPAKPSVPKSSTKPAAPKSGAGKAPAPAPKSSPAPKNSAVPKNSVAPKSDPNHPDEGARARQSIERTEAVLRSVNAKVTRSFNKKAREDFETARRLQLEAREALGQNLFARADRLTQESSALAREIAVHLGPPQDDPDYVAMTLGRTDDAIGRAKEVLRGAEENGERRRLQALERRQKGAHRLLKDGKTREAYAATIEVREGVLTLLRDCDDLPVPAETAERALKRASRALDLAKGELGERPTKDAARLARDARAQLEKARAAYGRKNYRDTLLYSKLVERDLEHAVKAQRGTTSRSG